MLNFLERSNRLPKDIDVLAATTLPADGEVFAVNREEFPKLRERTRIPTVSTRDGQHFKLEPTEIKHSTEYGALEI